MQMPFKASNLHAEWINGMYVIYSYGWYPILAYKPTLQIWYINEEGYSRSTARQISQCKKGAYGWQHANVSAKMLGEIVNGKCWNEKDMAG